jgi:hypothetical protein
MVPAQALLQQLREARSTYGEPAERRKRELLRAIAATRRLTGRQLVAYHEDLLFLIAFPGDARTRAAAIAELDCFAARWRTVPAAVRSAFANSGIVGTATRPSLVWPVARTFIDEAIELDWKAIEDPEALERLVVRLVGPAERDAFDGGDYTTREWIALAKRLSERDFAWLVREGAAARSQSDIATAWDSAEVALRWTLGNSHRSITHARLPVRRPTLRTGFRRLTEPAAAHVARPLDAIRRLDRRAAAEVVDLARSALAARAREVHAMNDPNLHEVYRADLGDGVDLVLIGVPVAQRLTLEANYGYLMLSNGVPIGYGGVSPLYRQANTGINIFDPYRGSEAAFLWAQALRVFRTMFGVRRFVINGYQFGAGNSEAISSGAYWFYYRLGFRPSLPENVALAAEEAERLRREPSVRSRPTLLRRLARGDLHLDVADFSAADFFEEPLLTRVGAAVARRIAGRGDRSHLEGERQLISEVQRALGLRGAVRQTSEEQQGFAKLAPCAALLGIDDWPAAERRALAGWLRAKGATTEREFAAGATRQVRFFEGLRAVAHEEATRAG